MGIKHFFQWYKQNFQDCYIKTQTDGIPEIDVLLLDLNGIFHTSAQKVFKYGSFAEQKRLLYVKGLPTIVNDAKTRERVYLDVCETINGLVELLKPQSRLFMGIDGPAPIGKQNQQRQRRFRAAKESTSISVFDSNCITPGTVFMDELGKYIDAYVTEKLVNGKGTWKNLAVTYSNEKVPGEGEHKAIDFIRNHGREGDRYCINGPDADLIMLSLATHKTPFYVFREDMYENGKFYCLDIGKTRSKLFKLMKWPSSAAAPPCVEKSVIDDFVCICFLVGNDFLPHVPSIEIIEEGLESMMEWYKANGEVHGHLTTTLTGGRGKVVIRKESLGPFLALIGASEKRLFEEKAAKKQTSFPDPMLLKFTSNSAKHGWIVNVGGYISEYNQHHYRSDGITVESICHQYIQGLQWVLTYYSTGCPSWRWYYPHQYAPMASELAKHILTYVQPKYGATKPSSPFQQLLSVLPPESALLLPHPLSLILLDRKSAIAKFCPERLVIDLAGKRREWEGITVLPMVNQTVVANLLNKSIGGVGEVDLLRNVLEDELAYEVVRNEK